MRPTHAYVGGNQKPRKPQASATNLPRERGRRWCCGQRLPDDIVGTQAGIYGPRFTAIPPRDLILGGEAPIIINGKGERQGGNPSWYKLQAAASCGWIF